MLEQSIQFIVSENWQEQRRNKPIIENLIFEIITGDSMRAAALDFIAYLRKNYFGIMWSCANDWWITLYCRPVCKISLRTDDWVNSERLNECSWFISLHLNHVGEYEDLIRSENLQDFINNYNPDGVAIRSIKRLLEIEKKAVIAEGKKGPSLYQQQKAVKPLIEDIIPLYLNGGMMIAALDFAAWLRETKMSPNWTLTNWWNINCKGKTICKIHFAEDVWNNSKFWFISLRLNHLSEYEDSIISEGLQNIVWNNIKYCFSCTNCAPGRDVTLLGKDCKGLCHMPVITVCDPDEAVLNGVKRLLELEKRARGENTKTKMK